MRSITTQLPGIVLAVVGLAACTGNPIYNLKDAPINTPVGVTRSAPDVEKAIRTAGAKHGWKMESPRPGVMVGTTTWRSHSMTVDITYDTRRYSIVYKDSANLGYDGTNIHRNYNYKVQELDRAIQDQLAVF